eukprot:1707591-Prymnesium_polylepis.1
MNVDRQNTNGSTWCGLRHPSSNRDGDRIAKTDWGPGKICCCALAHMHMQAITGDGKLARPSRICTADGELRDCLVGHSVGLLHHRPQRLDDVCECLCGGTPL